MRTFSSLTALALFTLLGAASASAQGFGEPPPRPSELRAAGKLPAPGAQEAVVAPRGPAGPAATPATPAPSAPPGPSKPSLDWVASCKPDVQKFCKALADKGEDVRDCLYGHEDDISEACNQAFIPKYRVMKLCKGDFEKFCSGKPLGPCLTENQDKLSEKCHQALLRGQKKHKAEQKEAPAEASDKPAEAAAPVAKKAAKRGKKRGK